MRELSCNILQEVHPSCSEPEGYIIPQFEWADLICPLKEPIRCVFQMPVLHGISCYNKMFGMHVQSAWTVVVLKAVNLHCNL